MSWEIINFRLIHTSGSVMKAMCCHQTLTGLPKHFPNKINQAPCTICYTEKMTTFPKGKTVDTTNLQSVELIHVYLVFYNMTSVLGFTSMLNILCENTIIIWLFTTASKVYPVRVMFCI